MNFRKFITASGKLVLAGRDAEQNEEIIKQAEQEEIVLHTKAAGSPFCNIKGKATKKDIKEAAVFCARYSQDWRNNKQDITVHYFKGNDVFKEKNMKTGTFGVKKFRVVKAKKGDIDKIK